MSDTVAGTRNFQGYRRWFMAAAALIPLVTAAVGRSFFTTNDDGAVLALLRSGDPRTFIISYPLSSLLVALYKLTSAVPWYSLFVLLMLALAMATMTFAVLTNKYVDRLQQALLLSCVCYFGLFCSNAINYTAVVTLLFVAAHMLALSLDSPTSKVALALLVPLVLLTRSGDVIVILLAFSALPLMASARSRRSFAVRTLLLVVAVGVTLAVNRYPHDSGYEGYKKFNAVRSVYNDLHFPMRGSAGFFEDEAFFKSWFPYDEKVFPTSVLVEKAPRTLDVIAFRLQDFGLGKAAEIVFKHLAEFSLIVVSLAYVTYRRRILNLTVLTSAAQTAMCFVLFSIRDVDRLSSGILFLMLAGIHLMPASERGAIKPIGGISIEKHPTVKGCFDLTITHMNAYFIVLIIAVLYVQVAKFQLAMENWAGRNRVLRPKQCSQVKEGLLKTKELHDTLLLPDLLSPCPWYFTLPLARETSMLGDPAEGWLPGGWLARSPLYYKTLRSHGAENFGDLFRQGKLALVHSRYTDYTWSRAMYLRFFNRNYAAPGCRFVPVTVYKDDRVVVEKFRLVLNP